MEIGIEQARRSLGDLADAAYHHGRTTYLTRHGRRVAAITPIQETIMQDATATTQIGTWATLTPDTSDVTIDAYVGTALGEFAGDYDTEAIVDDYRDAINAALPAGVSLHGQDYFIGPYRRREGWADAELAEVRDAIASVDLWEIVGRHDKTTA